MTPVQAAQISQSESDLRVLKSFKGTTRLALLKAHRKCSEALLEFEKAGGSAVHVTELSKGLAAMLLAVDKVSEHVADEISDVTGRMTAMLFEIARGDKV